MPYSTNPNDYPIEFAQLFVKAKHEAFDLDCGTFGDATNYCHRLHAFRRAMELHKVPGWTDLRAVTLRVRGAKISFSNNNEIMENIRQALGAPTPTDTELEQYLHKMETGESNNDN